MGVMIAMTKDKETENAQTTPYHVKLPGFVTDEAVGLGDMIKRVTYTMGIRACGGCDGRAATLNQWVVFTGRTK